MKAGNIRRITALEGIAAPMTGIGHQFIVDPKKGETEDSVLDGYGRDKIGPNDQVVIWTIIDPE